MENRLKDFRSISKLTQAELAKELSITRQTILSIEKKKYDPSLKLALKIADFFGVYIEDIFSETKLPEIELEEISLTEEKEEENIDKIEIIEEIKENKNNLKYKLKRKIPKNSIK